MRVYRKGFKEAIARLASIPKKVEAEMSATMSKGMLMVERDAKVEAPVNFGELRSSIHGEVQPIVGGVRGIVSVGAAHGAAVEYGSKPHYPPLQPRLASWVYRKLGLRGWEGIRATINLAYAIRRRGTRAQPFLEPAWEKNKAKLIEMFRAVYKKVIR